MRNRCLPSCGTDYQGGCDRLLPVHFTADNDGLFPHPLTVHLLLVSTGTVKNKVTFRVLIVQMSVRVTECGH